MNKRTHELIIKLINMSPKAIHMKFTFEELKSLFEVDPVATEQKVQEIFEDYVNSLAPEKQQRARAYNWRLQQDLRNCKDAETRLNKMAEAYWQGVKEFQATLSTPSQVLDQQGNPSDVVRFPQK